MEQSKEEKFISSKNEITKLCELHYKQYNNLIKDHKDHIEELKIYYSDQHKEWQWDNLDKEVWFFLRFFWHFPGFY